MADSPRFNRKAFQEWRQARVNRAFFQFLKDQRAALAEQWASGVEMAPVQQCKALLMGELSDLEWEDVGRFYGIEDEAGE